MVCSVSEVKIYVGIVSELNSWCDDHINVIEDYELRAVHMRGLVPITTPKMEELRSKSLPMLGMTRGRRVEHACIR